MTTNTQPTHTPFREGKIVISFASAYSVGNAIFFNKKDAQSFADVLNTKVELLNTLKATKQFIENLSDNVMDKALALKHIDEAISKAGA